MIHPCWVILKKGGTPFWKYYISAISSEIFSARHPCDKKIHTCASGGGPGDGIDWRTRIFPGGKIWEYVWSIPMEGIGTPENNVRGNSRRKISRDGLPMTDSFGGS